MKEEGKVVRRKGRKEEGKVGRRKGRKEEGKEGGREGMKKEGKVVRRKERPSKCIGQLCHEGREKKKTNE